MLRPDIAIALADVPYGALPGTKRVAKMGDRTQDWLSQLLRKSGKRKVVFAPVLPIDFSGSVRISKHIADDLADEVSARILRFGIFFPTSLPPQQFQNFHDWSLDEPGNQRCETNEWNSNTSMPSDICLSI